MALALRTHTHTEMGGRRRAATRANADGRRHLERSDARIRLGWSHQGVLGLDVLGVGPYSTATDHQLP
jgi:hypothetical protein